MYLQKLVNISGRKSRMNLLKKIKKQVFTTTGLVIFASCALNINTRTLADTNGILIAQKLGRIEKKIKISEVPITVITAARAASGGEPNKAQIQINPDGTTVYEIGGQNQQGFDFEMEITPNGEIIEIDEQIESSAVPEKVMKAFKFWLPQAKVISTWRSTRYKSFDYYYEIVMDNDFWVEIPADAKTIQINPLSTLHGGEN